MQFVLHHLKHVLGLLRGGLVVRCQSQDVVNAQVHPTLTRANVPDALEKLIEAVGRTEARRIPESFVVHGEALHQVLGDSLVRPLAKGDATRAADAEANRDDDLEM